tara:strand:- start:56 stop:1624 length:1569 start_codon:yes stop_codon:yes gene_type:complete
MAEVIEAEIKSNIGKVAKDIGNAGEQISKLKKGAEDAGGGVKKLSVGFGSLLKASGIVMLLEKAFEVFKETLGKNQKVVDFFAKTMTSLSIAFNDLFKFIESNVAPITESFKALFEDPGTKIKELGDTLKEGLVDRFNEFLEVMGLVGKAFGQLIDGEFGAAFDTIKEAGKETVDVFTGVDDSFEKVKETIKKGITAVKEYTKSTWEQATAVENAKKAAGRAEVEFARLNAQYLKDAEIQRQIRDDVSKTFAERIAANEELSRVLIEQQKVQKESIQTLINAAQAQYNINASEENWILLEQEKVRMLELEETITGQISEQKTNQVGLELELLDAQKQVRAEGLAGIERELQDLQDAYDLKVDMARKAGESTVAIDKQFQKQKKQIVQEGINAQLEAFSGLAGALGALAGESKELAIAQAIIDTYVGANKAFAQGGTVGFITAAAVIAAGLANVNKIMSTDVGSGGGGSVPSVAATPPAPQMMSGAFDLTGGAEPEAVKAYVVTDEMTNSQNQLANIRRRATI